MRQRQQALLPGTALLLLGWVAIAQGQGFSSGSTGADGAFAPTSNTTLTLPASGVFNFTTITIPSGITVTIGRNATNTPATLLATGDVTIAGILDLNAQPGGSGVRGTATASNGGLAGPGGSAGGSGSTGTLTNTGGTGLGPGGGTPATPVSGAGSQTPHCGGAGGGHNGSGGNGTGGFNNTCSAAGGPSYSGSRLLPLLGGSGGGGGSVFFGATAGGGGGGGGALLFVSSTKITLTGTIRANGGNGGSGVDDGTYGTGPGGGGSGGGLRLVAPILTGSGGNLQVSGGSGGSRICPQFRGCTGDGGAGASGRIRLEATTFSLTATMTVTPSQGPLATVTLASPLSLRFTSVAGVAAPTNPQGSYGTPDLTLPAGFTNPVTIALEGTQIPVGTVITVRSTPLQGSASSTTGSLTGTIEASTASVSLNLPTNQPTVLTAEATFVLLAMEGTGPLYAEGEEVTHVRVAAVFGGPSAVTYITRSGREVALP